MAVKNIDFTDIESGSNDNRPELLKALRKCRLTGATLLIAKLDRLSRKPSFLMELADSKLNFVAVDSRKLTAQPDCRHLGLHG